MTHSSANRHTVSVQSVPCPAHLLSKVAFKLAVLAQDVREEGLFLQAGDFYLEALAQVFSVLGERDLDGVTLEILQT